MTHDVEVWRYSYALLAGMCSAGFVATLWIRWADLQRGERIIRAGLIIEHLVIVYGALLAIKRATPGSITAPLLVVSLLIMLLGFGDWIFSDLLPRRRHGHG